MKSSTLAVAIFSFAFVASLCAAPQKPASRVYVVMVTEKGDTKTFEVFTSSKKEHSAALHNLLQKGYKAPDKKEHEVFVELGKKLALAFASPTQVVFAAQVPNQAPPK